MHYLWVCPNPPAGLRAVAVGALPLPADLRLSAVQELAITEAALELVKDFAQRRVIDRAKGLPNLLLEVVHVADGLRIHTVLDVAPEAGIGKRNVCHYDMRGAMFNLNYSQEVADGQIR